MKVFKCLQCGNLLLSIKEGTCIPNCCGKEMLELKTNSVDAAVEKHVPFVKIDGNSVSVTCGEVLHPMTEEHFIEFMILVTSKNTYIHYLEPGDEPISIFTLDENENVIASYAYCNLHGLWKSEK